MKPEETLRESDINRIRYKLDQNHSKEIEELEKKLSATLLLAINELVPEDAKELYKKYPFITSITSSISFKGNKFWYDKEKIINIGNSAGGIHMSDHINKVSEKLRSAITFYYQQLKEKREEIKAINTDTIEKIKKMTYGDLGLYYPELLEHIEELDKEEVVRGKEHLKKLEEKIKETIN